MTGPRVAALTLMVLVAAACSTGSGNVVTEDRPVAEFSAIEISGAVDVRLSVEPGAATALSVTYDDNLLDQIVTEFVRDSLLISTQGNISTIGGGRFVSVTVASVESISLEGASDLEGSGETDGYTLVVSGASDVDLRDLVTTDVNIEVAGASDVRLYASESITGLVSGASDVTVFGSPGTVEVETSGASGFEVDG